MRTVVRCRRRCSRWRQTCGACCASLRVDFHPAELAGGAFAGGPKVVPVEGFDGSFDAFFEKVLVNADDAALRAWLRF